MVRAYTNKLLDLVAEGVIDKDNLIRNILDWMPEREVKNFAIFEGYVSDEDDEAKENG